MTNVAVAELAEAVKALLVTDSVCEAIVEYH